jgi:hypothetical protein
MPEFKTFSDRGKESVPHTSEDNYDILRSMQEEKFNSDDIKGENQNILNDALRMSQGTTGLGLSGLKRDIRPMHKEDPDPDGDNSDDYGDGPITDDGPR